MSENVGRFNGRSDAPTAARRGHPLRAFLLVKMQKRPYDTPMDALDPMLDAIPPDQPVLIAGPTASGKSALALALAERDNRHVVNADALQVFENWRILTARPSEDEEARAPHRLYGHKSAEARYSVGDWLQELVPLLEMSPPPVIVGGTGLYFTALTEGLADIPKVPDEIRAEAEQRFVNSGIDALLQDLDAETLARIDESNPARVLRAWEVWRATGMGLAHWQDRPTQPLVPLAKSHPIVIDAPREMLNPRIADRFDAMLADGALDEAQAHMENWNPTSQSSRAIGAAELIAHLKGEISIAGARDKVIVATRQYAKRQRTWLRARMTEWNWMSLGS